MYIDDELFKALRVGNKIWVVYPYKHKRNELRHILGIIDDYQIVYKIWSYPGQRYLYKIDDIDKFQFLFESGYIKINGKE